MKMSAQLIVLAVMFLAITAAFIVECWKVSDLREENSELAKKSTQDWSAMARQQMKISKLSSDLDRLVESRVNELSDLQDLGTFTLSHYSVEHDDMGSAGLRIYPEKGIAVPEYLLQVAPFGSKVLIVYPDGNAKLVTVLDVCPINHRIDLAVESKDVAYSRGLVHKTRFYLVK